MSEKNILKAIKEMGYTQAEALELLKANPKSTLLTGEEKEEQEKEEKAKQKAAAEKKRKKEEKEEKDKEDEPTPPTPTEPKAILEKLDKLEAKLEEIEKSGRIPGKTPSEGQQKERDALPESMNYTIQKNMFETDV